MARLFLLTLLALSVTISVSVADKHGHGKPGHWQDYHYLHTLENPVGVLAPEIVPQHKPQFVHQLFPQPVQDLELKADSKERQSVQDLQPRALDSDERQDQDEIAVNRLHFPATCDWLNTPKYSCYNCYTQMVCKSTGGKLQVCNRYCNNGQCSSVPSAECLNK